MADEQIQVPDGEISKSGNKFVTFEEDIRKIGTSLDAISIQPGDFKDGDDLKKAVQDRVTKVKTFVKNIEKSVGDVGTNLIDVAKNYKKTDDDTTITAKDLNTLVNSLDKDLPGFAAGHKDAAAQSATPEIPK